MSPFVESTLAAALASLDRACETEAAQNRELQRHLLLAYEQLRAVQDLVEVERRIAAVGARANAAHPAPLRLVGA